MFAFNFTAVFATGARDGFIMIWDTRSNQGLMWEKPDNFISNSHHAQGQGMLLCFYIIFFLFSTTRSVIQKNWKNISITKNKDHITSFEIPPADHLLQEM